MTKSKTIWNLKHLLIMILVCFFLLPLWFGLLPTQSVSAQLVSQKSVANAVLFYSPSCGHCHYVITEFLPIMYEQYGDSFNIVGVDVSTSGGSALFTAALQYFNLDSSGVPFLVIGDHYLIGSVDIPEQLPGLVDQYLVEGGVGWPAIPGFAEAFEAAQTAEQTGTAATGQPTSSGESTVEPAAVTQETTAPSEPSPTVDATPLPAIAIIEEPGGIAATFSRDLAGNTLAVIVLIGMLISLVAGIIVFLRRPTTAALSSKTRSRIAWAIPLLCVAGLVVAGYLAYVETTQVEAVCGPVGDCNIVQQSEYAYLFGFLPIGVLGLIGYLLILLFGELGRSSDRKMKSFAALAVLGMTTFGLLFSIYLTFLEPFVIGATCAWCLTSAVIMTVLFWLSLLPGREAYYRLAQPGDQSQPQKAYKA